MSWRNIRLIFLREVGDQLRDRRTLFMVIVLPLLLYPALGIGMLQMSLLFSEQPKTVVILGADNLPEPSLLNAEKNRIDERWFGNIHDSSTLKVLTDHVADQATTAEGAGSAASVPAPVVSAETEEEVLQMQVAQEIHRRLSVVTELRKELLTIATQEAGTATADPAEPAADTPEKETGEKETGEEAATAAETVPAAIPETETAPVNGPAVESPAEIASPDAPKDAKTLKDEIARELRVISDLFVAGNIQVLIVIPDGFSERVRQENEQLANRQDADASALPTERLRPMILRNTANEKSSMAYGRVREALDAWEQALLDQRLRMANLPTDLTSPVNADRIDLAKEEELAANVWSKLFPAMLIVMAMTGAFHPAVDLGAGEKERGTMETLLISPALRSEIVIGKFLTVLLFSLVTAMLNLASMGMTGLHILNSAGGGQLEGIGDFSIPPFSQMMWVGILAIPLASLFASLSLAFALFARSSKEGQYYLTPLLTVTMGLTVFCLSPAVEITPFYSMVPVMGPALLLKGMLLGGTGAAQLMWYVLPVLTTSFLYSAIGLAWAIDQFHREEVLFRESERFDLRLWFQHLFRDKEPTPNFWEAAFCFVLIMLMQFALLKTFGSALNEAPPDQRGLAMVRLLIVQQLVIIACPALLMGILLTTSMKKTFQFRLPAARYWLLGLLLPIVIHPLAIELQLRLAWFFPSLPEHAKAALATMADGSVSFWLILFAFAVTPAICEELAFRGPILSGFRHRGRDGLAILFSALLFGVMHMIPQQVFNASLLGLVLGLLAVKSGSIFPAMVFHFVNNTLGVLHGQLPALREKSALVNQMTVQTETVVHYPWWILLAALLLTGWLIRNVLQSPTPRFPQEEV